jgi:hypothetical protein
MSILRENLTPHIEYINAMRCAVIREHAISNLVMLKEFCAESPIGEKSILRRLHLACKAGFLSDLFDDYHPNNATSHEIQPSFCFSGTNSIWAHKAIDNGRVVLSTCWKFETNVKELFSASTA